MSKPYLVYILYCADDTLYTGITTDTERRLNEHNSSALGAKYTARRRPVKLVYSRPYPDRSSALRAEYEIKQLSRTAKIKLIESTSS